MEAGGSSDISVNIYQMICTTFQKTSSRSYSCFFVYWSSIFGISVEKDNSCSNLCEEYCQHFQLIFLLPLISPYTLFIYHFTQHCVHSWCFCNLSKLTVARSQCGSSLTHSLHYATRKPAFSSLPPHQTFLQVFVKSLRFVQQNTKCYVHTFCGRHF
jgi:hypothetical protein